MPSLGGRERLLGRACLARLSKACLELEPEVALTASCLLAPCHWLAAGCQANQSGARGRLTLTPRAREPLPQWPLSCRTCGSTSWGARWPGKQRRKWRWAAQVATSLALAQCLPQASLPSKLLALAPPHKLSLQRLPKHHLSGFQFVPAMCAGPTDTEI